MESQIKTYTYPNGDIQRIQVVRPENWDALNFLEFSGSERTLGRFSGIYRDFLVPAAPWLFGNMVLFRLPEDVEIPMGHYADREIAAAALLPFPVPVPASLPRFPAAPGREHFLLLYR